MGKYKVVAIGGGTGTFAVLQGLKNFADLELAAIVTMTDSGGSTGRLRDEFGMLPVGDARACLVALAREDEAGKLLRELFLYRFSAEGSSLAGHNFGNLFLTALTDILGSEEAAISAASEILNVVGEVIPVTTDKVHLVAEYENGDILRGEAAIDEPDPKSHDCSARVSKLWTDPVAVINPRAKNAIINADYIIIGPGDLYSSLLSNMVVEGMPEALRDSKAKKVYISNLVSKYGQTHDLRLSDYANELIKYTTVVPDHILVNNEPLPIEGLAKYALENSFPVQNDFEEIQRNYSKVRIIQAPMLSENTYTGPKGDVLKRSLLRHDSAKLAKVLHELFVQ